MDDQGIEDRARRLVERSRIAQGLPYTIEDQGILRELGRITSRARIKQVERE
jgi:hypothetical protein